MPYDLRDQPLPIEEVILHFGFDLRTTRLMRFQTQSRLSEASGVSQGTWSMIENGLAEGVRLELLARIAVGAPPRPCASTMQPSARCGPPTAEWPNPPNGRRPPGARDATTGARPELGRGQPFLTGIVKPKQSPNGLRQRSPCCSGRHGIGSRSAPRWPPIWLRIGSRSALRWPPVFPAGVWVGSSPSIVAPSIAFGDMSQRRSSIGVVRTAQRDRVRRAHAPLPQSPSYRLKMTAPLWPPSPILFESA